jgi:fatty acid elongase 3
MLYELITSTVPRSLHPPAYLTTWQPGVTPLSTWKEVSIAMATYFLVIFSGREVMRYVSFFSWSTERPSAAPARGRRPFFHMLTVPLAPTRLVPPARASKLPAFKLQFLFQAHNLFLSVGSAVLLACMVEELCVALPLSL